MTETEAELINISKNLEFAHFRLATGFTGESNGNLSVKKINKLYDKTCIHLEDAMNCVNQLIQTYKHKEESDQ